MPKIPPAPAHETPDPPHPPAPAAPASTTATDRATPPPARRRLTPSESAERMARFAERKDAFIRAVRKG